MAPKRWSGRGRPTSLLRCDAEHQPVSAKQLALGLSKRAWRRVTWREDSNAPLASRFAAVCVRPAHRDYNRATPRPEEWCLIEWPVGEPERRALERAAPSAGLITGCAFRARCSHAMPVCATSVPAPVRLSRQREVACHLASGESA